MVPNLAPPVTPTPAATARARWWAWGSAAALGAATAALYAYTLAPGLGGTIDSAEFQHAAYNLAVVHPTGYPLYLLLARLWITLVPVGEPAWRVNLLSAVFAVAAVLIVYATVLRLTRLPVAGLLAGALVATHGLVWEQAVVAEVNSLNLLLVAAVFYALLRWRDDAWPLEIAALLLGLALANHRTSLLLVPGLLVFLALASRGGRRIGRATLARSLLALALPLTLYLYIPLRAATTPWYTNTWDNFWREVGGESAWPVIRDTLTRPLLPRVRLVADLIFPGVGQIDLGRPGTVRDALIGLGMLALAGLGALAVWERWRRADSASHEADSPVFWLYVVPFLIIAGVMVIYDVDVIGDYLALDVLIAATWAGLGAAALLRVIPGRLRGPGAARVAVGLLVLGLLALPAWQAWRLFPQRADAASGLAARRVFWEQVKAANALAPDAFLIGEWQQYNELRYLQAVERWRPDVQPHVLDDLVAGGHLDYVDEWLAQGRSVYLAYPSPDITDHFATEAAGPLLRVMRREEATRPPLEHPVNVRFGDVLLEGYSLRPAPARAGGTLRITLFWKALARPTERLVIFTHLVDPARIEHKIGQKDDEPGRGYRPTNGWAPGQQVVDTLELSIAPDARPGPYQLMVGLYTRFGEKRLPAVAADGRTLGNYWEMARVEVAP